MAPTPNPVSTIDLARALAGEFDVTSSGQATYKIPIVTAPGSAGLAPNVSVNYSSGGGNGPLGLGWSLNTGGSISRCRQTEGQDKNAAPITWGVADRFCLNGDRLLVNSGYSYGAPGSQYKTEIDSYARITAIGGSSGQPNYFKVEYKDGRIDYYGHNDAGQTAVHHKLAADKILSWMLTTREDSAGNKIRYFYQANTLGDQPLVSSIRYAYGATSSHAAELIFHWDLDSRMDLVRGYIGGLPYQQTYLLGGIVSNNNNELMRYYSFTYDDDSGYTPWDRVSRITSIRECSATSCTEPTRFDWLLPDTSGFVSNLTPQVSIGSPYLTHAFGDINSDGLLDLVWMRTGDTTVRYAIASVDVQGRIIYSPQNFEGNQTVSVNSYVNISPPELSFIDYNGDGRQDLVIHQHPNPASIKVFLSKPQTNGGWLLSGTPVETLTGILGWTTLFADLNGDGLEDLIGLDTLKFRYLKTGTGFDTEKNIIVTPPAGAIQSCYQTPGNPIVRLRPETGDFNGDGRTDFIAAVKVCPASGNARYEFHLYTSHIGANGNLELHYFDVLTERYADTLNNLWGTSDRSAGSFKVLDLNADGLSDVIYSLDQFLHTSGCPIDAVSCPLDNGYYLSYGISRYKFSTGKQLSAETQIGNFDRKLTSFIDFNGDDHPDILTAPAGSVGQPGQTYIRLWNTQSNTFNATSSSVQMPYAPTIDTVIYQDLNGDKAPDYFFIGGDAGPRRNEIHALLNKTKDKVSNRIWKITNGLGHKTQITYESLAKTEHYSRIEGVKSSALENICLNLDVGQTCWDRQVAFTNVIDFYSYVKNPFSDLPNDQTLNLPPLSAIFDVAGSVAVVTGTMQDSPDADTTTPGQIDTQATKDTVYFYEQLRAQAAGRGWLGFKKFTVVDGKTGLRKVVNYRQDWPFTGNIYTTESYTQSGKLLGKTENLWGFVNCYDTSGNSIANCAAAMRLQADASGTSALGAVQPFLRKSITHTYALKDNGLSAGDLLSTTTETNRNDVKGNSLETTSVTTGSNLKDINKSTTNTYDYSGSTWSMQQGRLQRMSVTSTDATYGSVTRTSSFTYSTSGADIGLLKTETIEPDNSAYTVTTTHTYSLGNKTKSVIVANGQTRQSEVAYDSRGRYVDKTYGFLTNGTNPDSAIRQLVSEVISRDKYGTPTEIRSYTSSSNYVTKKVATTDFGTPYFTADSTGAFAEIKMGTGSDTYGVCPADNKVWSITQAAGGAISIQCSDILGRVRRAGTIGFDGNNWSLVDTEYDKLGRTLHTSAPYWRNSSERYWTSQAYDVLGRVVETRTPYKSGYVTTTTAYENLNVTITNPKGQVRTEKRDLAGQIIEVIDPNFGITQFAYDSRGNMREMRDPAGNTTTVTYDLRDRKTGMSDPDKGNYVYQYNSFGDITCQMDGKGQISVNRYDIAGRLFSRTDRMAGGTCASPTGSVDKYSQWTYDTATNGWGQLANTFDSTTVGGSAQYQQSFNYDSLGRVSSTTTTMPGHNNAVGSHYEKVLYDQYGRVDITFDAARSSQTFTSNGVKNIYNAQGYLESVKDAFLTNGIQRTYYKVNSMNARGNVTSAEYANGVTQVADYYPENGLTKTLRASRAMVGLPVQDINLDWDEVGNLSWREELGTAGASVRRNIRETFSYDSLNRLRTWVSSGDLSASETANYNNIDNITDKTGVGNYLYGSACGTGTNAGPHALCRAGSTNYTYDKNGNMLTDSSGRTMAYTSYDLPRQISKSGHQTAFSYGPNRARYKRVDTSSTSQITTTLYLGAVEKVYYPDGSIEWKRNIAGVGLITQKVNSSGVLQSEAQRYLIKDHLGSLSLITDEIGAVEQSQYFDPWGKERKIVTSGSVKQWLADSANFRMANKPITTRGFTGHEQLAEVGLIHMNGRIYDGTLGRFVQADPIIQDPLRVQSLNRYSYVWNNPLNATDPSGFQVKGGVEADETPDQEIQELCESSSECEPTKERNLLKGSFENDNSTSNSVADVEDEFAELTNYKQKLSQAGRDAAKTGQEILEMAEPTPTGKIKGGSKIFEKIQKYFQKDKKVEEKVEDSLQVPGSSQKIVDKNIKWVKAENKIDPAADKLAERLGGVSQVKFPGKFKDREFDFFTDQFLGQTKPANFKMGSGFRDQAKATFEASLELGRTPYFHFDGPPESSVINKLKEYGERYGISPIIDTTPL